MTNDGGTIWNNNCRIWTKDGAYITFPVSGYRYSRGEYLYGVGDKKDRESVKVNDQYRIEFRSEVVHGERTLTICNILELSNHYK